MTWPKIVNRQNYLNGNVDAQTSHDSERLQDFSSIMNFKFEN